MLRRMFWNSLKIVSGILPGLKTNRGTIIYLPSSHRYPCSSIIMVKFLFYKRFFHHLTLKFGKVHFFNPILSPQKTHSFRKVLKSCH